MRMLSGHHLEIASNQKSNKQRKNVTSQATQRLCFPSPACEASRTVRVCLGGFSNRTVQEASTLLQKSAGYICPTAEHKRSLKTAPGAQLVSTFTKPCMHCTRRSWGYIQIRRKQKRSSLQRYNTDAQSKGVQERRVESALPNFAMLSLSLTTLEIHQLHHQPHRPRMSQPWTN